ncbi:MAG TPA: phosphonate dehydrogenase [Bryobacteraceae bacterium]|jgi:phosphonate dehydrogenase|nr:phosphonate dehydrogenase [Bryobacteraceae bacterium]
MSRPRIVVTQRIHSSVAEMLAAHAELIWNDSLEVWPRDLFLDFARHADALMVFMPDSLDEEFIAACPRLKIVAAALKGYDNFDVAACTKRGIWFTIVPGLLSEPTAELAVSLMLGLARNVRAGDEHVRSGAFAGWRPILYGQTLRRATVGIVGLGEVGRALARMLIGFECRVLYCDRQRADQSIEQEFHVSWSPFDDLLAVSDFVAPLLPLTPGTLHLFERRTIAKMKRGAFLINVARGSIVNEEAVADALETGRLGGYAADTFEMEDWARADRPSGVSARLREDPQTLFTPHLGSAVAPIRLAIERAAAHSILQVLRGERPTGAIEVLA